MPNELLIDETFKEKAKQGEDVKQTLIQKFYTIEDVQEKGMRETTDGLIVPFIISTGSVDRVADVIDPNGWKLSNYKKNPVVLFGHDYGKPPVAKGLNVRIEDGKLKSDAQFTPKDLNEFGYMIGQLYAKGYMKAVSVGLRGLKWAWSDDEERAQSWGIDFQEVELLEYSAVPVPANPEALVDAKCAGIDVKPALNWATDVLDGYLNNITDPQELKKYKQYAEQLYKSLNTKSIVNFAQSKSNKDVLNLKIKLLNLKEV